MTLESLFYISQTIAAFAIVGSLLFVGLEVRTSNRENRQRTIEQMLQNYRELRGTVASNADLSRSWVEGLQGFPALAPVDNVRFLAIAMNFMSTYESFFLHHRDGLMGRDLYEPQLAYLNAFLPYPGMQAAWALRKDYFHQSFRTLIDEKIAIAKRGALVPALYQERPS